MDTPPYDIIVAQQRQLSADLAALRVHLDEVDARLTARLTALLAHFDQGRNGR